MAVSEAVGVPGACVSHPPSLARSTEREGAGPAQSWEALGTIELAKGASLVAQLVKNLPAMWETWVGSLGWEDPWRRERLPTPVFLPGEFHGQRSLVGNSPWGRRVRHN